MEAELLNDRYEVQEHIQPISRKRKKPWPVPLFTPTYSQRHTRGREEEEEKYREEDADADPDQPPCTPPPSPTASQDPAQYDRFEIPSSSPPFPPPPSSTIVPFSSVPPSSSSSSSSMNSNNYSLQYVNPYRRMRFEKRHKRGLSIQDIYNSSDDEEEQEERELLHRDGEDSTDSEEEKEEGGGKEREQQKQVQAYHEKYHYDMSKVKRKRDRYWQKRDIQRRWCAVCTIKHKNKAKERFKALEQIEQYWLYNLGRMSVERTIDAIHTFHLAKLRRYYPKRGIDPYTGKPKPPHWWSPVAIGEHFMKHDCHPYTFHVIELQTSKNLLKQCNETISRFDLSIGKEALHHQTFLQRKSLLEEIARLQTYVSNFNEKSSANHSLLTAMNSSTAKNF